MKKLYRYICLGEEVLTKSALFLIIVLVFIAAILRTLKYPLNWSVDIAQLLFAWTVFIGADIAFRRDKLMGVDLIISKFPSKIKSFLKIFFYCLIIIFLFITLIYGLQLCIENSARTFQSLRISYSWVTLSLPVGSILMVITSIIKIKKVLTVDD
ncbi:TRAP transporter small permease subunit [Iocasia frigidifontis]|uniref:TRAP transporter small permease subunit n=1 Tax=Iocasia fonsfrigidae TaxID=2682810 RepID=A0A8A7KNQ8_9FIRM|nr:TRAP transporter small permease subunit [Iocasia fonsfrigidae]QTL99674.1 TRAP transporter small permease subunit [Iocasia fonsfrigidae]